MAAGTATFDSFADFSERVKQLYTEYPDQTRLVVKYRHPDGMLIMRATNDRICLKYNTDQAADERKLEELNSWLFAAMCDVPVQGSSIEAQEIVEGLDEGQKQLTAAQKKKRRKKN